MFVNIASVESDFSILDWEKDEYCEWYGWRCS